MSSEELFYACLDRIDSDARVAEEFLIGCVYELSTRFENEITRDMVRDNFETLYVDKYERELMLVLRMKEDSLASLMASSLDISLIYKQVNIIYDKIELSCMDKVTANCHAQKAERAGRKLILISKKMKKATRPKREGLFDG